MPRLLPVLGLPLLVDGVLTLVLKLRSRLTDAGAADYEPVAHDE